MIEDTPEGLDGRKLASFFSIRSSGASFARKTGEPTTTS
jgi:hypothetical protein